MSQSDHLMNMLEDMIQAARAMGASQQMRRSCNWGAKQAAEIDGRISRLERGIEDHKKMVREAVHLAYERGYQDGRHNFPAKHAERSWSESR